MPLQISLTGERTRKVYETSGTKFHYEEARGREVQVLRAPFLKSRNGRSRFDTPGFTTAVLSRYIVGWENLEDANGTQVPYAEEIKAQVIEVLPPPLLDALFSAVMGTLNTADDEEDDANP